MRKLLSVFGLAGIALFGAAVWVFTRPSNSGLEVIGLRTPPTNGPAMCPWRSPEADMHLLFVGAKGYKTATIILSAARPKIIKRMDGRGVLDTTALYVYEVTDSKSRLGSVLVQRAAGPHGAIEIVVGIGLDNKITGVKIQRQREPQEIANRFMASNWLHSYIGKDCDADFIPGKDLPDVAAPAKIAASCVATAVRSLLIQFDEGGKRFENQKPSHTNHENTK